MENNRSGKVWMYETYANSIAETDKIFFVNGFTSKAAGGGTNIQLKIAPFETDFKRNTIFTVRKYSVSYFIFDTAATINSGVKNIKLRVY
jgi:hypothetical protein